MYIECLETYPVVNERGKRIHVPRSVAEVAIYRGEARLCPRPAWGSAEWRAERAAAAAQAVAVSGDVDPNTKGISWGVRDRAQSAQSVVTVIKRTGCETTFYSTPPTDCPPSIVAQWRALTEVGDSSAAARGAIEAAKRAQFTQTASEKLGVLAAIFKK